MISECALWMICSRSAKNEKITEKKVEKRIGALRRFTGQTQVLSPYAARPTCPRSKQHIVLHAAHVRWTGHMPVMTKCDLRDFALVFVYSMPSD